MHNDVGIDKLSHSGAASAGRTCPKRPRRRAWPGPDRPARRGDRWGPEQGRGRFGNGGRNGGSGVASSRSGHGRHQQSRRSAVRSTGSCPVGVSSGERRAGRRPARRGCGVPRRPGLTARYRIISGVPFMNRHRSLGLYPDDLATAEPSRGSDPDALDPGTHHPWKPSLDSVFLQALRSTEPTLNLSYSENEQ